MKTSTLLAALLCLPPSLFAGLGAEGDALLEKADDLKEHTKSFFRSVGRWEPRGREAQFWQAVSDLKDASKAVSKGIDDNLPPNVLSQQINRAGSIYNAVTGLTGALPLSDKVLRSVNAYGRQFQELNGKFSYYLSAPFHGYEPQVRPMVVAPVRQEAPVVVEASSTNPIDLAKKYARAYLKDQYRLSRDRVKILSVDQRKGPIFRVVALSDGGYTYYIDVDVAQGVVTHADRARGR